MLFRSGYYINEDNGGARNGEIDGEGTMILEGDWTNYASNNVFINPATKVTVEFRGTTSQIVGGTGTTSFEDWNVNNNVSGSGVSFSKNVTVSGTCTLTDGVVVTGSDTLILTSATAADLTGYSDAGFVYGNLRRYASITGTTYAFPVGKGTATADYHLAEFINTSLSGISYITASVSSIIETSPNDDGSLTASQDGTSFNDLTGETAIWDITPNPGATLSGNYGVNLYIANIAGLTDNQFAPLKRPTGSSTYADWDSFEATTTIPASGIAGRTVTSGYAQRTGYTSFSEFGIGKSGAPLPIELIYFSAEWSDHNNTAILLEWKTMSETNNDYFVVKRSTDAINFTPILQFPGAGNSNQVNFYSELDKEPYLDASSYYRLKQVDFDGNYSYSQIEAVNPPVVFELITVFPNPAVDKLEYHVYSSKDTYLNIIVINSLGQKVISEKIRVRRGVNKMQRDLSFLSSGNYIIQATAENGLERTQKEFVLN